MPGKLYKRTRIIMGMPVTVAVVADTAPTRAVRTVYGFFTAVDEQYSTYKPTSEVSQVNQGLAAASWSGGLRDMLARCEITKAQTRGYFDAWRRGMLDPSGIVKGWAIQEAACILDAAGYQAFYIDAGGDIQARGHHPSGKPWRVGVRNPFKRSEIVKVLTITTEGVATSGSYARGGHVYNPKDNYKAAEELSSVTVIGPNIYEADRFATAAYAMGVRAAAFIESLPGLEGYVIDKTGIATMTSGLGRYTAEC